MLSAFSLGTFVHKFTILVINAAVHSVILALANTIIFSFFFLFSKLYFHSDDKRKKKKRKKKFLYNPDSNSGPFGYISYMLPTELQR